ncbi:MAG: T9SS type A sorting domain-containing protein, partial [Ignavibacteriaceae bacterium]|nr:T9SS type A sorting domain-containing protein [Ignavibacteriaceae bacterium]
ITPYPAGQTDIDGLAVSDDQIAYLVTDQQDSIYIYDLVGGTYLPAIANPWTSSEVFCGGTWIYEIGGGCNLFEDTFDSDISQWTEVGGLGTANWFWGAGNQAGGAAPGELTFAWTPAFTGDSYLMSPVMPSAGNENTISFQHYINWYGGPGTVGVAYTTDSGTSWTPIWSVVDPPGSIGPEPVVVNAPGDANFQLGFYWSGNSFNINFWHIDDVCVNSVVPVELTSFAASVNNINVNLNWTTATETNNQGFEIERNSGNGFENVGYVPGFGTTTEQHSYSYTDANLSSGIYSYRLKQIDFDGTFDYSETVEVEIVIPDVYSLSQNYPNPFNPSTKITFSLAADSKVSLKVFDVLGQEVASLVNQDLTQGVHTYDFNATGINSGVYFYKIEATGVNGTKFVDVKKMILVK